MKLGFIFDVCFARYNGHYYSINLNEDLWNSRYLKVYDEVVVIGRYKDVDVNPEGRQVRSDFPNVKFICIEDRPRLKRIFRQHIEEKFIEENIKDCDSVICRSWWGVKSCKKLKKNYMMEVISCTWDSYWNHSLLGKIVALPCYLKQKNAVLHAPYVLYVTQKFLQGRYPARGIAKGVSDVSLLSFDDNVLERRIANIKQPKDKIVIGTAAAIDVKFKGQKYVIDAISILKKRGKTEYIYQLAGNGNQDYLMNYAIKKGVKDQIQFLGSIPREEMVNWFDKIDIYIQPSFQEGLPRSVVEAMSRGLPCIGSDVGGIPELLESKYICKRHKRNFSEQIADKIASFNQKEMLVVTKRNYKESKEYDKAKLEESRVDFLRKFQENKTKC